MSSSLAAAFLLIWKYECYRSITSNGRIIGFKDTQKSLLVLLKYDCSPLPLPSSAYRFIKIDQAPFEGQLRPFHNLCGLVVCASDKLSNMISISSAVVRQGVYVTEDQAVQGFFRNTRCTVTCKCFSFSFFPSKFRRWYKSITALPNQCEDKIQSYHLCFEQYDPLQATVACQVWIRCIGIHFIKKTSSNGAVFACAKTFLLQRGQLAERTSYSNWSWEIEMEINK